MDRHQYLTDLLSVCLSPGHLSEAQQLALDETQEFVNPDRITQAYMEVSRPAPTPRYLACKGGPLWLPAGHSAAAGVSGDYLFDSQ